MGLAFLKKIFPDKKQDKGPTSLEKKIRICRSYTKLWADFFRFFADGLDHVKIKEQDESAFFQIMSRIAQNHFHFVEEMGEDFSKPQRILEVLCDAINLSNMKSMSEGQFSKTQLEWHEIFIDMNKSLGRLIAQLPPPEEEKPKKAS